MAPLQFDPGAAQRAASQLRTAADRVRRSVPLPTAGPPELASYVSALAHAERRLAAAEGDLLDTLGVHAEQVTTGVLAADR